MESGLGGHQSPPTTHGRPPNQPWRSLASARALAFTGNEAALTRLAKQLAAPELMRESLRGISGIQSAPLIPLLLASMSDESDSFLEPWAHRCAALPSSCCHRCCLK